MAFGIKYFFEINDLFLFIQNWLYLDTIEQDGAVFFPIVSQFLCECPKAVYFSVVGKRAVLECGVGFVVGKAFV